MIPDYIDIGAPWRVLPSGIHKATLSEIQSRFAISDHRKRLFYGFKEGVKALVYAGCKTILLDGSYVTEKEYPKDYDACWDPTGVDDTKLDKVFFDFSNNRKKQKERYMGEYFPMLARASHNQVFAQYFQTDRFTGKLKGIINLDLSPKEVL